MFAKCIKSSNGPGTVYMVLQLDKIAAFYDAGNNETHVILEGGNTEITVELSFDDFSERIVKYKMGNIVPADFEQDSNQRVIPKLMKFY